MKLPKTLQSRSRTPGILFAIITSAIFVLTASADSSNCTPPPAGLVSWWRGEGDALDQAGGNNGVSKNGVGFEAGVVGQTFRFNGSSNSYVEVADSPALRLTNAVTIECWAKRLNTSEVHTLVEKGGAWTGGQTDFEITLNDTYAGGTHFGFGFAGGWRGCAVTPDTAWHHYAAVAVSGEANPLFYIDGVPQTVAYKGGAATIDLFGSTSPLHIGALLDPQTGWFYYSSTMIDEPAIFNRALSAAEIQAIYHAGSAGKCVPPATPACVPAPENLVSWWRGEGNALDQVGGNNGVLVNRVGFDAGVVGQAFRFNASSNSYVAVADSPTLRFTNALTIECWAKRLNTSEVHILVEKGGDWTGGQTDFEVVLNDTYPGGRHFGFSFTGGWRGCAVTPDTAWHHYAAVAVSGQADPILYIDGVPQTIAYGGGAGTMNLSASTRPLHIGAQVDAQTGWFYYSSTMIDEPAIFNRALSAAEIQAIYHAGSAGKCVPPATPACVPAPDNLVSWWRGEGNAMDSVSGNDGRPVGGVVFPTGAVGQAFDFNGTNSYVKVPNSANLNPTGSFSIETWVYPQQDPSGEVALVIKWGDTGELENQRSYGLSLLPGGALDFFISDLAHQWDTSFHAFHTDPGAVRLQAWNHVVAVYDQGSGTRRVFVDGVLAKSRTDAPITIYNGLAPLTFGAHSRGGGWVLGYFDGRLDEVSLYDRALSADEVQALYNAGSAGKCPAGAAPSITTQPASQTVPAGVTAMFTVTAAGTSPLTYQWRKGGVALPGSTDPTLRLPNTTTNDAGAYDVVVTNSLGAVTSQVATLTVRAQASPTLLNVNFAAYANVKLGFAGTGQTPRDFWNNYTAPWQPYAWLSNLTMADGTPTTVGLAVQNGAGHWGFTHPDLMYNCYCYSQDNGDVILSVTNLPSGEYDFYLYGHGGGASGNTVFQLLVDGADYGNRSTATNSDWALTNWVEGAQYVVYRNVAVTNGGAPVTIKAHPGESGGAQLNGLQIAASLAGAPVIRVQPTDQVVVAGLDALFSVTADGAPQLAYQWRKGGVALPGSTDSTLRLPNITTNDAGAYDVVIANSLGAVTSQVATLTVRIQGVLTLLNVNFAAYANVKLGFAGTGQTPRDFWNNYTAPWQPYAWLSNLTTADGTPTTVGLTVQNGAGHWDFTHPDLMYNCYCYSQDNGDVILTVTNLPSGEYDFYLYGHGGGASGNTVFQLLVDGADYGNRSTATNSDWALTNWVEGAQYVVYRNVAVTNGGAPVTIKAHPGESGGAQLNGMQIAASSAKGSVISVQPTDQVVVAGLDALFSVTADGAPPLSYHWRRGGVALAGSTNPALRLPNTTTNDAGAYDVVVANNYGAVTSQVATLTVLRPPAITSLSMNSATFMLTVPTEAGPTYVVEYKDELADASWKLLATFVGTGFPIPITDNGLTNATRFYRVRVR